MEPNGLQNPGVCLDPTATVVDEHGAGIYPHCAGTGRQTVHAYGEEIGTYDCEGCDSPGCPARLSEGLRRVDENFVRDHPWVATTPTNSYGEPPARFDHGFVGCGSCPDLPSCARGGQCRRSPSRLEMLRAEIHEEAERIRRGAREQDEIAKRAEQRSMERPEVFRIVEDRFGEHDRAGWRHFGVPRVDPRVRTAPHGDPMVGFAAAVRGSAILLLQEADESGPSFWSADNAAPGRLTPGRLKLWFAKIAAAGGDVAQAMADQIDFEWEERRWREPAGDAVAAENGMGC